MLFTTHTTFEDTGKQMKYNAVLSSWEGILVAD